MTACPTASVSRAACLLAAACSASLMLFVPPALGDTLIEDVNGIRFDRDGNVERFEAMLIDDDGKVVQLYRKRDKRPKEVDYKLDGNGRTLIPSFIDSHLHLMDTGLAAMILDLSDTTSLQQAQARIAEYAARFPNRAWIVGLSLIHI